MNKLLLLFSVLLAPVWVYADSCEVEGDRDFIIQFDFYDVDDPTFIADNTAIDIYFQALKAKWSRGEKFLWNSEKYHYQIDSLFYEHARDTNSGTFNARIEYSSGSGRVNYYRKRQNANSWGNARQTKNYSFPDETLTIESHAIFYRWSHSFYDDGISNLTCTQVPVSEPFVVDVCPYVPETIQTNNYSSVPEPKGKLTIAKNGNRINLSDSSVKLSFGSLSESRDSCQYSNSGLGACQIDTTKTFSTIPVALSDNISGGNDVECTNNSCMLTPGKYKDINIKRNAILTLTGGEYWFETLKFAEQNASLNINGPTIVHFHKFSADENNVRINVGGVSENLLFIGYGQDSAINIKGNNGEFYAYFYIDEVAKNYDAGFRVEGNNNKFYGGMTANDVSFLGNNNLVYSRSQHDCTTTEPDEDYTVQITADKQFFLQCSTSPDVIILVNKVDSSGTETPASGVSVDVIFSSGVIGSSGTYTSDSNGEITLPLTVDTSLGEYSITATLTDDTDISDTGSVYIAPYIFDSDSVDAIAGQDISFGLKVLACDDNSVTKVDEYTGDKSLNVNDFTLVQPTSGQGGVTGNFSLQGSANSPVTVNFNSGEASAMLNYDESGVISFILSDPNFTCPAGYDCTTENNNSWRGLQGVVNVNLRPWTFAICHSSELDNDASNDISMSGTATGGDGFVAAGEHFELNILPIYYQTGGTTSGRVEIIDSYCNSNYVTVNFFNRDAPAATVTLNADVATPSGGESGNAPLVSTGESKANTAGSNNLLLFDSLYWDEVGSLDVEADTQANYLTMDINTGYREIGRFYPNHIAIYDNDWDYATGHDEFAYMSQETGHRFTVEAMNVDGNAVANYEQFADSLIVDIKYAAEINGNSLLGRIEGTGNDGNSILDNRGSGSDWTLVTKSDGSKVSRMAVSSTDFKFVKNAVNSVTENYRTQPDGPYNDDDSTNAVELGLTITDNTQDVVSFSSDRTSTVNTSLFGEQPDFRYGRLALSDVGGNEGSLVSVPLKAEYWSGSNFETNTDDSGSEFDVEDYCIQTIWREESGTTAATFNGITANQQVTSGEFDELTVSHNGDSREQVRLWLRQQSIEPVADGNGTITCSSGSVTDQSWMRYNWRNLGDEDPSTVVVFGIYRGNDRVIYRGESRLTGQ